MQQLAPQEFDIVRKKTRRDTNNAKVKKFGNLKTKRQKKTNRSERQKYLDIVLRKTNGANTTREQVREILANENINVNVAEQQLLFIAALNQVDNKALHLTQNLVSNPITCSYFTNSQINFVSSDYIHCCYLAFETAARLRISECVNLKKLTIASTYAMVLENPENFQEFYYEDFNSQITSPNWFFDVNVDVGVEAENPQNFFLNNLQYVRGTINVGGKTAFIYYPYDDDRPEAVQEAIGVLNGMKKMYDKRNLKMGVKQITKNPGVYYLQMNITPTSFCPATLKFPDNQNLDVTYLFHYETIAEKMLALLNQEQNYEIPLSTLGLYIGFTDLSQLPSVCEFLCVVYLLYFNRASEQAQQRMEWREVKAWFDVFRSDYTVLLDLVKFFKVVEKLVLNFLDAFDVSITIDKINNIISLADKVLLEAETLYQGTMFDTVNFIKEDSVFIYWKNFFRAEITTIAAMIKKTCTDILNPSIENTQNVVLQLRSIALMLYEMMANGSQPCFSKIRSPAAFLGNLFGGETYNSLQEVMNNLKQKVIRKVESERERVAREQQIVLDNANRTAEVLTALRNRGNLPQGFDNILRNLAAAVTNPNFYDDEANAEAIVNYLENPQNQQDNQEMRQDENPDQVRQNLLA